MRLLPATCEAARAQEVRPRCITKHLETGHHGHTRDQRDARTRQPLSPDTWIRAGHGVYTANCLVSKGTHLFQEVTADGEQVFDSHTLALQLPGQLKHLPEHTSIGT